MISVHQVAYTYPKRPEPAIAELDFAFAPGETFGFLGPSGADPGCAISPSLLRCPDVSP